MSSTPIDFPPNCPACGWQLRPPADWLLPVTLINTHPSTAPGVQKALELLNAELARARHAHTETTP